MDTDELDFDLPQSLVAQHPCEKRDASRLMVVNRKDDTVSTVAFRELGAWLNPGDCLALNDTRVIRARLRGRKQTGGAIEIFLLREMEDRLWMALVRPSARVKPGARIELHGGVTATVESSLPGGQRLVRFSISDVLSFLEAAGEIPLPPYIHRGESEDQDATRYQTVYARSSGAVAAPTAGLHFTRELLASLAALGIAQATLTLHVGYGTFKPIKSKTLKNHEIDPEDFELSDQAARILNQTRQNGGRVIAVGTTTTRVLETQCWDGRFRAGRGLTRRYIYPPYTFTGVDVLLTNFHLPRSSLLALVCAFGGTERILRAYKKAVRDAYRFYSYGDAMLIL